MNRVFYCIYSCFVDELQIKNHACISAYSALTTRGGGVGYLGSSLLRVPGSQRHIPNPIIVYSMANYRPHLSHFFVIFAIPN